mmetsp:Transcript_43361/g.60868  ORF Transcript_43361/g.60868 Transcript_43361/m.60868 type:complete len:120 (-) Transcript_43361:400-759(-)
MYRRFNPLQHLFPERSLVFLPPGSPKIQIGPPTTILFFPILPKRNFLCCRVTTAGAVIGLFRSSSSSSSSFSFSINHSGSCELLSTVSYQLSTVSHQLQQYHTNCQQYHTKSDQQMVVR